MKKIFLLIIFVFSFVLAYSQSTVFIRADTVKIKKEGGNSNLVIENSTRGVTNGVLTNIGNGVTRFILPTTGGSVDTAANGLTDSLGRILLGGFLYKSTIVATGVHTLTVSTSNNANPLAISSTTGNAVTITSTSGDGVHAVASSGGTGVYGNSVGGIGTIGVSDNSYGVQGISTSSHGLHGNSVSGIPIYGYLFSSGTNNVLPMLTLSRGTSGTAANGIGGSIYFEAQSVGGAAFKSNEIISKFTDAATLTRTSQMIFTVVNAAVTGDALTLNGNKSIQANGYGSGTFTGTATKALLVDASGNIIEGSVSGGGTGTGSNLSYNSGTHAVDIDGGGTSAVIPIANSSTYGLVRDTTFSLNNGTQSGASDSLLVTDDDSTAHIKQIEMVAGSGITITPAHTAQKVKYTIGATGSFPYIPSAEEFTGSTSTSITLAHSASAAMVAIAVVSMNGVLFEEANYSISGTALTLSGVTRLSGDIIKVKYFY